MENDAAAWLSGWGRFPGAACIVARAAPAAVPQAVAGSSSLVARGNGRGYGDCAFNPDCTLAMLGCDAVLAFDPDTGVVCCEAGLLLSHLIERFVPEGWFVPVTPGTKFVSVGGMVAADVHGKNHHGAGSFGSHVLSLRLALADGSVLTCSREADGELFAATIGGMGLTGVILQCTFRMIRIETRMIRRTTLRSRNLDEALAQFEASQDATYSVAWIDSLSAGAALGRSILQLGEHATLEDLPAAARGAALEAAPKRALRVPVDLPAVVLNRFSVRVFNGLYYARGKPGRDLVDLDTFFYPLDALLEWNRIYGRRGFLQYQCVVPLADGAGALRRLLHAVSRSGPGSFLSVLKRFGPQDGMLSFPMEGYTLALDLPVSRTALALADRLDGIVAEVGGRLYLAKDSRMPAEMMRLYPGLERFRAVRRRVDPGGKFASAQSRRLGL